MPIPIYAIRESPEPIDYEQSFFEMQDQGLDPYVFTSQAGAFYGKHQHEYDEIRLVLKGMLVVGIEDKEFKLQPGDRIEIPKNAVHWIRCDKDCLALSASKKMM